MNQSEFHPSLSDFDFGELEPLLHGFESAWQIGTAPSISEILARTDRNTISSRWRMLLLCELIKIDIEFRWKRSQDHNAAAPRRFVDDYFREFNELRTNAQIAADLIAEEYRARQRWGDRPAHQDYIRRFPQYAADLERLLFRIDREIAVDSNDSAAPAIGTSEATHLSNASQQNDDPRAPVPYSDLLLQKYLGSGGMGKVYRALQKSLKRSVAVKFLQKRLIRHPHAVERFITEAQTVAGLDHPHIVTVHGLGKTPGGGYFLVMELASGGDLQQALDEGMINASQAIQWLIDASRALECAHQKGIVHCDLKPGNLLRRGDGRIIVSDFGLAQTVTDATSEFFGPAGTAAYMAPEQIDPLWGQISVRTDVYALGAVLYALLTGRPPYTGSFIADIWSEIVVGNSPPPPCSLRADLPEEISDLCMNCLSSQPEQRFPSATDVGDALAALL